MKMLLTHQMNPEIGWQERFGSIVDGISHLLTTGLWSDCQFIVGTDDNTRDFRAHKLILSVSSPVFERMFQGGFKEESDEIVVVDVQPDTFDALLKYVYRNVVSISSFERACELSYAAKKYMMPHLFQSCASYMSMSINANHGYATHGFEMAKLFEHETLKNECKEIIFNHTSEVITGPNFTDVEMSTLTMILEEICLGIQTETELFQAVERWTQAEFKRLGIDNADFALEQQGIYDKLVPKICFLSMSLEEFNEGPACSNLLTSEQKEAISMRLTSDSAAHGLPEGFSTSYRVLINSYGNDDPSTTQNRSRKRGSHEVS